MHVFDADWGGEDFVGRGDDVNEIPKQCEQMIPVVIQPRKCIDLQHTHVGSGGNQEYGVSVVGRVKIRHSQKMTSLLN